MLHWAKIKQRDSILLHYPNLLNPPLPSPHPTFPNIWRPKTNDTDHIHHTASHKDQAKGQHSTPLSQSPQPTSTIPPPHFPQHMKAKNKWHWPHPPYCIAQRSSKGTALYSTIPIPSTPLPSPPPIPQNPTYEGPQKLTLTTSTMLHQAMIKQRDSTLLHYPDLLHPPPPSPHPTFPNRWRPKTNYTDRIHHTAPCKDQAVLNVLQELGVGLQIQHPNLLQHPHLVVKVHASRVHQCAHDLHVWGQFSCLQKEK